MGLYGMILTDLKKTSSLHCLRVKFYWAPSTIAGSRTTATINSSIGMNFWISPQWGLNVQGTYKFSSPDYESMRSHHQLSVGFIYSFKPRVMVFRLWDGKRR